MVYLNDTAQDIMIYEQAIGLINKGKSVSRRSWSYFSQNTGVARDTLGFLRLLRYDKWISDQLWIATDEDKLAEDWEVVDRINGLPINEKVHSRKAFAHGTYSNFCVECEILYQGDKRSTTCADCAYSDWKPTHQHIKTGRVYMLKSYTRIEKDWIHGAIYESVCGQSIVRPAVEFFDLSRYKPL
jgi:hypothetical protein